MKKSHNIPLTFVHFMYFHFPLLHSFVPCLFDVFDDFGGVDFFVRLELVVFWIGAIQIFICGPMYIMYVCINDPNTDVFIFWHKARSSDTYKQ